MRGISAAILLAGLGLAGCDTVTNSPRPAPRVVAPLPEPAKPSARSEELAAYYQRVENQLVSQGLLRQDGGGPDTPFAKRNLVENFVRIAAFEEFTIDGTSTQATGRESTVRRWTKPIRVKLEFGAAVSDEIRKAHTDQVRNYLRRLQRVTGHPISLVSARPNFHVAVLTVDELEDFAPRLQQLVPDLETTVAQDIVRLDRPQYCAVFSFFQTGAPFETSASVAILRAEHPKLLRESCIHEELAQGLGLTNDSPAARPSIFNDDDEFALLTRHDELLLQILYDDRLPLGSSPAAARPVVEVIAAELLGGES